MSDRDRLRHLARDGDLDAAAELVELYLRGDDRDALDALLEHLGRPTPLVDKLGRPLSDWFDAPQPGDTILALSHALLDAAAALHRAGHVQRHWRPGDIRMRELAGTRTFVALDLGWRDPDAIDAERRPWIDTLSPEQVADPGRATPADDVFAITVLAWMLYTGGQVPWPGASEFERLRGRLERAPQPPGLRRAHDRQPELERALVEALSPHRDSRPMTLDALRERLDGAVVRDGAARVALAEFEMVMAGYGAPPDDLLETTVVDPVPVTTTPPPDGLLTRLGRWLRRGSHD